MPGKKPKRKVMRSFKLEEISAVDKPAQEGAKVAIMKRKTEKSLSDRILDSYLAKLRLAEPMHAKIAKGLKKNEADQAWDNLAALETSLHSIVVDPSLSDDTRVSMMKASVGEFLEFTKRETPNVETRLEKAFGSEAAKPGKNGSDEGSDMNLRQLQKQMRDLNGKLDKVLAAQKPTTRKANQQLEMEDADLMGKEGGPPAANEDEAAARLRAMLSGEKEAAGGDYSAMAPGGGGAMMDEMDKAEEGEYLEEEAEKAEEDDFPFEEEAEKSDSDEIEEGKVTTEGEEEEPIAAGTARPIGGNGGGKRRVTKRVRLYDDSDDTIIVEGRTFHKAKVGSTLFAVLHNQQQRLSKVEKQAQIEREARELMEFAKVAEDELPNLPGTPEQKARLLKTMSRGLNEEERQLVSKMLRAGDRGLAKAFETLGTAKGGDIAKARGGFEKRISEVRARDGCSRTEAMQKARREYPDEFSTYQGN